MAIQALGFALSNPKYQHWSYERFNSWEDLYEYAVETPVTDAIKTRVTAANTTFETYVNANINNREYGLWNRNPANYKDAIARTKFVYWDKYKEIKARVEKLIREGLQKKSEAEVTISKFVYNTQLGEFMFDKAAMSLIPSIYYYSVVHKKEVDKTEVKSDEKEEDMTLISDGTKVIFAIKVILEGSTEEKEKAAFFPNTEEGLKEAHKERGYIVCVSYNKKVYLLKEKQPKPKNAIRILVALTAGGLTAWEHDFYTGIAAVCCLDILEELGYSIHLEVIMGGGRCGGNLCINYKLKFDGVFEDKGRRFFSFPVKTYDEQVDLDNLLYTIADPSFHNIKFMSIFNNMLGINEDTIPNTAKPNDVWHGIEYNDMVFPIGMYHKKLEKDSGNKNNTLFFGIRQVGSENEVVREVMNLVLTCEQTNAQISQQYENYGKFN